MSSTASSSTFAETTCSNRTHRSGSSWTYGWTGFPCSRHELPTKLQWFGIHAEPQHALRSDAAGNLLQTSDMLRSFTVKNFGLQIRYRYEIAPMSELFVVCSRGGLGLDSDDDGDVPTLMSRNANVRDAEQVLAKLRYHF
jgi:hypothetical protein